ncbi:MAG: thioredoxin family protein [Clostridia bacterium]|nr:thioredoxin family protein [Clostridia bacterium]
MLDLGKENFEAEILQFQGTALVDYYGDGCVPCAALMPFIHEMAEKYGDKIKFTSFNTTAARRLAISQKILGLPTIAVYQNGAKVEELIKEDATRENIEAMIKKYYV